MRVLRCGQVPSFIQITGQLKAAGATERHPRTCGAIAAVVANRPSGLTIRARRAIVPPMVIVLRQAIAAIAFAVTSVAVAEYILWAANQ